MNTLLEQSISLQAVLDSPWIIGTGCFLFWLIGGALFRNYHTKWYVKHRKENPRYSCKDTLDGDDRGLIMVARLFFPLSVVVFIIAMFFMSNIEAIKRRSK